MFDAKFDIEIDLREFKNKYVYHVSPFNKKDKILRIGLCPKSSNKTANYSSRIYLTLTLDGIYELLDDVNFTRGGKDFIIFKIRLPELLNRRSIRFFKDSAYIKNGIYTYENIPPEYIEIERIYNRTA